MSGHYRFPLAVIESSIASTLRQKCGAWTAEELAELFSFNHEHIYKLAKQGRLPCFRLGGGVRFDPNITATWWEAKAA
jgi:excisionase family DNA binding protein